MSPRNPRELTGPNETGSKNLPLSAAVAATLLTGMATYGNEARAAVPSVGTATEVADVNTSDADQRSMVDLGSGKYVFIEETTLGGDSTPMFIDTSATTPTPTELCGSGTYGNSLLDAIAAIDLASSSTLYGYKFGSHTEITDTSTDGDYSSCSESTLSSLPTGIGAMLPSYDYISGTLDYETWNGSDNDISVDGASDITTSNNEIAPSRCAGTNYLYYTVGMDESTMSIYVRDITDTSSETLVFSGGYAYPKCNGSTLHFSQYDGTTWNLYEAPITFPSAGDVDADEDGVTVDGGDCNDANPDVYPGAPEDYTDGEDTDCDDRADTPEWSSIEVNGQVVENGGTIYATVGENLIFSAVGVDEETLSEDLDVSYALSGDIGSYAAPYRAAVKSGDSFEFIPEAEGTITVNVSLTDSDGNAQNLSFTVIAGASTEDLVEDEELETGRVVVDGEGATTVESSGVSWNGSEITITNGYVSFSGVPDTTYAGLDGDGNVIAFVLITEPNDLADSSGWVVTGVSSSPSWFAGSPPPPNSSVYGEYSDNDNPDLQVLVNTNTGFDVWGTHEDSETGALELDASIDPTSDGEQELTYAADVVDNVEDSGGDDTGTPDPGDDTGTPEEDDTGNKPVNTEKPDEKPDGTGCDTTGSSKAGWLLTGLGLLGLLRRKED